jgi:hypothetical protein
VVCKMVWKSTFIQLFVQVFNFFSIGFAFFISPLLEKKWFFSLFLYLHDFYRKKEKLVRREITAVTTICTLFTLLRHMAGTLKN